MILLVNSGISLITPPVGPTLFVGCAIGKVTMEEVSRGLWPFCAAMCSALLIVTYVPRSRSVAAPLTIAREDPAVRPALPAPSAGSAARARASSISTRCHQRCERPGSRQPGCIMSL
jgi:hypothetical protein